jgi:hypothetical protein
MRACKYLPKRNLSTFSDSHKFTTFEAVFLFGISNFVLATFATSANFQTTTSDKMSCRLAETDVFAVLT